MPNGLFGNMSQLFHEVAWCQIGNKPSIKTMMTMFYDNI